MQRPESDPIPQQPDGFDDDPQAAPEAQAGQATGEGSDELRRELDAQRDRYLRLAAEYDNFRKRTVRERQDAEHRGQSNMVKGMLDTLDDLARVAHVDPTTADAKTFVEGVAMVERKLLKSLAGHGLEIIDPLDQPFDPAVHEAVATEPAASREDDDMVGRVYQVGYLFNGQLLRPARVVVKQWNG